MDGRSPGHGEGRGAAKRAILARWKMAQECRWTNRVLLSYDEKLTG